MVQTTDLLRFLSAVREVLGVLHGSSVVSVVVFLVVYGMSDDLVAGVLVLVEELLKSQNGSQNQSQFADEQSFKSEKCETSESNRNDGGGFQFQEKKERQEHLQLLLLAPGCERRMREKKSDYYFIE